MNQMAIRRPAVAGGFYPGEPQRLTETVGALLAAARRPALPAPKAVIAPHAGYVYSGRTAAAAYARLAEARGRISRVVLLGPCHRVPVRGLALPAAEAFATPMGQVRIAQDALAAIANLQGVEISDAAHAPEHSLEVHLPFLQAALGDFELAPIIVGGAPPELVADALERLWGGPETTIVVSSDLSHYLPYAQARETDATTAAAIEKLDLGGLTREGACGRHSVAGLLLVAQRRELNCVRLEVCNSGDTAGKKDRVVGYGAWAFTEREASQFSAGQQGQMIEAVRRTIRGGLRRGQRPNVAVESFQAELQTQRATFVTLKQQGRLRGCIGSTLPHRPLIADLVWSAYSAAFADPRFKPLTVGELDGTELSISILSVPVPLPCVSEADLLIKLRPKIDGLILIDGPNRGIFLPQVWSGALEEPAAFLRALKQKARLAPDHWSDRIRFQRYSCEYFGDQPVGRG